MATIWSRQFRRLFQIGRVTSNLRVLDAARSVVDEIQALMDAPRCRLVHVGQLRDAMGSVTWNIREAYGRSEGADRNQFFRHARASAEETDEQVRANYACRRITKPVYHRLHNRLVTIRKMLDALLGDG